MKNRIFTFLTGFFIDDLFKYFRKNKTFFFIGLFFLFLSGVAQLMIPLIFGELIGSMPENKEFEYPELSSFALVFGFVFLQFSFMFARDYFFMRFSLNGISSLKKSLFEKLLRLPMAYHNRNSVGGSMSILNNDIETIKNLYSSQLSKALYNIFILIAATVILMSINYKLSLILLAIFGVSILVVYSFSKKIRGIALETQTLNFILSEKLEEALQKVKTIKIFTSERVEVKETGKKIDDVFSKFIKNEILSSILSLVSMFSIMGSLLFMVWYASYMITSGEITVGDTIPIVINLMFVVYSISGISKFLGNLEKARGTTLRLVDVLNSKNENSSSDLASKNEFFRDNIFIKNASMFYENSNDLILSNINIKISKGDKIAIVGRNGSGKSSIVNILLRLYPLKQGDILVDGTDFKKINLEDYRKLFSVVSQDISLFNSSIEKNICYPDVNIDQSKMDRAKKLAKINFSLEDRKGKIGNNGDLLSGGQRQKISLARAIYKDSDIIILDEVTNSLDQDTRAFLSEDYFQNYLKDKTVIYISHEMSLIKDVDNIIVLESGKIVEVGTYNELVDNPSKYSEVAHIQ